MTSSIPPEVDPNTIPLIPPPPGMVSNFVGPSSSAIAATAVCSTMIVLEFFFVGIRLFTNHRAHKKLRLHDWCAICAVVLSLCMAFVLLYTRSLGRHEWDISLAMIDVSLSKISFAGQMIYGPGLFIGKCCLFSLYYQIFSCDKNFRWKIYGGLTFSGVALLLSIPVDATLCSPLPGTNWLTENPKCIGSYHFSLFQGLADVLIDLFLLYLPIPRVMALHLPVRKRCCVIAIFLTGTIAIAASAAALVYRVHLFGGTDPAWDGYVIFICSFVETAISVICSSMPAMAAFSKNHVTQLYKLMSLPSTLFSSRSKDKSNRSKNASDVVKGSTARQLPSDSHEFLAHPHSTEYIKLGDHRPLSNGQRTKIDATGYNEHPDGEGIFTTVRMEQEIENIV